MPETRVPAETELDVTYSDDDRQAIVVRRGRRWARELEAAEAVRVLTRLEVWAAIGTLNSALLDGEPDWDAAIEVESFPFLTTRGAVADMIGRLASALA